MPQSEELNTTKKGKRTKKEKETSKNSVAASSSSSPLKTKHSVSQTKEEDDNSGNGLTMEDMKSSLTHEMLKKLKETTENDLSSPSLSPSSSVSPLHQKMQSAQEEEEEEKKRKAKQQQQQQQRQAAEEEEREKATIVDRKGWVSLFITLLISLLVFVLCMFSALRMWETPVDHGREFENFVWGVKKSSNSGSENVFYDFLPTSNNAFAMYRQIEDKLKEDRLLSLISSSSSSSSTLDASLFMYNYLTHNNNNQSNSKKYNVILFIEADSLVHIYSQYMQLASFLHLRVSEESAPEIVSRVVAWLYRQQRYLLVFDVSNSKNVNKYEQLEMFIPKAYVLQENKQGGDVVFLLPSFSSSAAAAAALASFTASSSPKQRVSLFSTNYLQIDYNTQQEKQALTQYIYPPSSLSSSSSSSSSFLSTFLERFPFVVSVENMYMLRGVSLSTNNITEVERRLQSLSKEIEKEQLQQQQQTNSKQQQQQQPQHSFDLSATNTTHIIGKWVLEHIQLTQLQTNILQLLSLSFNRELSFDILYMWASSSSFSSSSSLPSLLSSVFPSSSAVREMDKEIALLVQAGVCYIHTIENSNSNSNNNNNNNNKVLKLTQGIYANLLSSLTSDKRIALSLELLYALSFLWPTLKESNNNNNHVFHMPLRAPQYIFPEEITNTNDSGNNNSSDIHAEWGRQYYSWLFFNLYLSHSVETKNAFAPLSLFLHVIVDVSVRAQTELSSVSTQAAKTQLLTKAFSLLTDSDDDKKKKMIIKRVDNRKIMELLTQAGHILLGVHGLTKEASRVFSFRFALSHALTSISSPSHTTTTAATTATATTAATATLTSFLRSPLTGDEIVTAHRDMAIVLSATKRFHDAFEHIDQALGFVQDNNNNDNNKYLFGLLTAEKGDIFLQQASSPSSAKSNNNNNNNSSQLAAARSLYEKSLKILPPGLLRALAYHRLAVLFEFVGDGANSILNHEKALEIENTELGSYHVGVVHRLDMMGESWRKLGRAHEGLRVDSKALQITKEITDSLDPWFGKHLSVVGIATAKLNHTKDRSSELPSRRALKHLEQALNIETEAAGENHPLVGQRLQDFADLNMMLGLYEKALIYYRRAYRVEVSLKGFQDPSVHHIRQTMETVSRKAQAISLENIRRAEELDKARKAEV